MLITSVAAVTMHHCTSSLPPLHSWCIVNCIVNYNIVLWTIVHHCNSGIVPAPSHLFILGQRQLLLPVLSNLTVAGLTITLLSIKSKIQSDLCKIHLVVTWFLSSMQPLCVWSTCSSPKIYNQPDPVPGQLLLNIR